MEDEKNFNQTPFIEIRDPQLNVSEIMRSIESKIPLEPGHTRDWRELTKLSYKPESPEGFRKFDPAGTAHLFEKGITSPKFTNPKLWFIKGPIRYLVSRLISVYSLVDKKLSENRIRAFFSVLHELIRLGRRLENLEGRFDGFYKEYLLKKLPDENIGGFGWANGSYFTDAGIDPSWNTAIEDLKHSQSVTVLFPRWGEILKQLSFLHIKFLAITTDPNEKDFIEKKISPSVQFQNSIFPIKQIVADGSDVLVYIPLNQFPSYFIEKLFVELSTSVSPKNSIYFSILTKPKSNIKPFSDVQVSEIDINSLPTYLERLGFTNERNLSDLSETKIFKYTKS
ncbi:hypothetical protein P3G55_19905 [Leptospira sp. 96542]|nr:hypothetical protein [Leptospira sp. 96542]